MKKAFYFNMERLKKYNFSDMLRVLENYYYKRLPKNKMELKFHADLSGGQSFLVNPKALFASRVDLGYKVQYLLLAAKRSAFYAAEYGIMYLDLSFFPDLDCDKIKHNPLLKIDDNKLYFLYEN